MKNKIVCGSVTIHYTEVKDIKVDLDTGDLFIDDYDEEEEDEV